MSRTQLGPLAAVVIVVLRLAIGVHFLAEGLDKVRGTKPFSSAGFLGNAKGPLAPLFKGLVADPDGHRKLDADATLAYWTNYRDRVARHHGFDEDQVKQTEGLLAKSEGRLNDFFAENEETLDEYYKQLERRDANAAKPERAGMQTLQTHDARIAGDWMKLKGQLLSQMDALWKNVETEFNNVATSEQRAAAGGPLPIGRLSAHGPSSECVDVIIPWFDLIIGLCLILGLFTRTAAIMAGLFLASVCASQWPGYPGAAPIYYQTIEMLALFTLAAVGAGKVASVDALLCGCRRFCCPPKSVAGNSVRPSQATGTKR
ncbi:MAG: DoxX family protein [Pirellulaceae bacterium]